MTGQQLLGTTGLRDCPPWRPTDPTGAPFLCCGPFCLRHFLPTSLHSYPPCCLLPHSSNPHSKPHTCHPPPSLHPPPSHTPKHTHPRLTWLPPNMGCANTASASVPSAPPTPWTPNTSRVSSYLPQAFTVVANHLEEVGRRRKGDGEAGRGGDQVMRRLLLAPCVLIVCVQRSENEGRYGSNSITNTVWWCMPIVKLGCSALSSMQWCSITLG